MRWAFDPDAVLAEESLPDWCTPRAGPCAAPSAQTRRGRERYVTASTCPAPGAAQVDVTLAPDGAAFEIGASAEPGVTLRCASATYAMLIFGRWKLPDAIASGKVTAEGNRQHINAFVAAFVGG